VDLDLSSDQELFSETTGRFLAANWTMAEVRRLIADPLGSARDAWDRGAELGWTSMLVPEEFGGGTISGEGVRDLGIIAELLGRSLFAGPVLPTNIVADALARNGSEELAKEHLPKFAAGQETAAWAVAEENDDWLARSGSVKAVRTGDGYRLTGVKTPIQDAHVADQLLVSATTGNGVLQFLVPASTNGVTVHPLESMDLTRRFARVVFEGVEVPASTVAGEFSPDANELETQLALALSLQCAETVGATDRMYEVTLQYMKDRKAFGRPIGSYQALKHRVADMLLWLESAKAVTDAALKAVQLDADASNAASLAKAYVADRCPVILRECLQLHGGIGYTWEHDLHLYLRRVETNAAIYGGADFHCDRLAPAVGL
jgi:alkylation response protein AidB-like acyl-CoA dehydrogenase